jgi:hypothetical protein
MRNLKSITMAAAVLLSTVFASAAWAHQGPGGPIGLGLGVGTPTGLTLDASMTQRTNLELSLGLDALNDGRAYVHAVYEWAPADLVRSQTLVMPVYFGVGGFLADHDPRPTGSIDLGVRAPLGVSFDFQRAPLQIFAEAALLLTLVEIDHDDHGVLGAGGYAGLRYWF